MQKIIASVLIVTVLFSCRHTESVPEPAVQEIISVPAIHGKTMEITLSDQKIYMRNGFLGLQYFPDEAVIPVRREPTYRILVTSAVATYLLEGEDLERIISARKVLTPGVKGSFDNGYTGISGCYRRPNGKLYAFYHAEDHEDMGVMAGGIPGYYGSVGCAVSDDDGLSWMKLGQAVTSQKSKRWSAYEGQKDKGAGEPGVVAEKSGRYLFLYYSDHSRVDSRGVQICLARADLQDGPPVPGLWRKYYNGEFIEPAIGGKDTLVISGREIAPDGEALFPHPTYSPAWDLYILVFSISCWTEAADNGRVDKSGVYIAFSRDGIEWSRPQLLIRDNSIPLIGRSLSWMANIIWDDDTGTQGRLVYGYTPRWGHEHDNSGIPHHMAGRRISFRLVD
jgi:hypothetical protein